VSKPILHGAVCCLGVSAFITQLTLMRELLSVFSGNELIFGIVLGNWLLLTGAGAVLGRTSARLRSPLNVLVAGQILVALLPIAIVVFLRTRQDALFSILASGHARGAEIGVTETVASCFVLLAPYCLVTGYLLTLACRVLASLESHVGCPNEFIKSKPIFGWHALKGRGCSAPTPFQGVPPISQHVRQNPFGGMDKGDNPPQSTDSHSIGQVYFLDNVGSVAGGLLFMFVLIHFFNHFGILYFPAMLNLLLAMLVAWSSGKRRLAAVPALAAAGLVVLMFACNLDQWSTEKQYAPQHVVYHNHSPYGRLVVTESAGQLNFIESGVPLFAIQNVHDADQVDIVRVEEAVHYAMAQRPDARQVLLISGGVSGTAREILKKYQDLRHLDYVELDPLVLQVAAAYMPEGLTDPRPQGEDRLQVWNTDGRLFVKQTERKYDVVIVDAPGPSTSQLNRFYTREFFAEVKKVLAPDGVLCFPMGTYPGYLTADLAGLIAVAYRTAAAEFEHVEILPCGQNYFLASDGALTVNIADRLQQAGVETKYVKRNYLDSELAPERLADVRSAISLAAPINEDFNPILYYYHLRRWMSQFTVRFGLLEGTLTLLLAVYLVYLAWRRPVPLAIFTGGFAASALEVVLLMGAQILYGCLYYQVGLIVTMFMLGLGIGSWTMNRFLPRLHRNWLAWLGLAIAAYAVALPMVLIALGHLGGALSLAVSQWIVPLLTLVLAILVGMEFPLAGKLDFQGTQLKRDCISPLSLRERVRVRAFQFVFKQNKQHEELSQFSSDENGTVPLSYSLTSTAARLFTADFLGAALGALLVSTLLIPLLGVSAVCFIAGGLNVLSAGVILASRRNYRIISI
jgi:spermidine synthase